MITIRQLTRPFSGDGGAAYIADLNPLIATNDVVYLLENGKQIGVAEAPHQDIRDHGSGRYSVWKRHFYFSASDNSDCNVNGRDYQIVILNGTQLRENAIESLQLDDEALLRIIAGSTRHNNKLVPNFFTLFNWIEGILQRWRIEMPKSVLEIGCGKHPFTALRFLLEGCERYVANDLFEVQSTFAPNFIAALKTVCGAIEPRVVRNLDAVFQRDGHLYRARGLEPRGAQSFDTLEIAGDLDFIHSTSVLEHVQEPIRIAKRMAELLPSGTHMVHSIDFRDHQDFDKPFEFLKMTAAEYAAVATENRWRPSEWVALLEESGFDILERYDKAMTAESIKAGHGVTEAAFHFYRWGETITPSVTEEERECFAERFRHMDLVDLSIETTQVLCRKR